MLSLNSSITEVKGIGESTREKFSKLGVSSIKDVLNHLPSRYLDYSKQLTIKELKEKESASFIGKITNIKTVWTKSRKLLTQAKVSDNTGSLSLTWFNNPYIKKLLTEGETYIVAGKPSNFAGKLTIISPTIEAEDSTTINTKGFVPIYPQTAGLSSRLLRKYVKSIIEDTSISDPLSEEIVSKLNLLSLSNAYKEIHFPTNQSERWLADKRLAFNEHLKINIENVLEELKLGPSFKIKISPEIHDETAKKLPFKLTIDQEKTVKHLYLDVQKDTHTHRLIQGDTGSGKTATLLFLAHQAINSQTSCAIVAPTEILANQHFATFQKLSLYPKQCTLVTGSVQSEIDKKPTIYIGTHALFNRLPEKLKHNLLFIAIDEQHRFGVEQRKELLKRTPQPHIINLSATPIPRTVALGLLGEINISNIKSAPQNRLTTKTYCITETKFQESTDWLNKELELGNQVFAVCPHIRDQEDTKASVEKYFSYYQKKFGSKYPVYAVHGKIKPTEQNEIIKNFKGSGPAILVATSLIEVGIDIPEANIIIIHSADLFGLAQLHQLRGRVGRGGKQGYCFLVSSKDEDEVIERLELLKKYHSGLVLAQKDLRLRGAGEVFGVRQHGNLQTRLKYFWSKRSYLSAKSLARKLVSQSTTKAQRIASELLLG